MGKRHERLFERGSAPWCVKRYKEVTLTRLLEDLAALEKRGLEEPECEKVLKALRRACALVSAVPDSSVFYQSFWEELNKLRDLYEAWNNVKGTGAAAAAKRRNALEALIKQRRKMWKRFPRHRRTAQGPYVDSQQDLLTQVERALLDDMHLSFKEAVQAHPDLCPSLRTEIRYYEKVVSQLATNLE